MMTKSEVPCVSVIIPTFNSADFIEETMMSVLAQSMPDLELIVVDDCSQDETLREVDRIASSDRRVRVLRQIENLGVANARNRGLDEARGRYVAFLDSDDCWLPEKLEMQLSFMAEQNAAVSITSYETIEENGDHRNFVIVPQRMNYNQFLRNPITSTLSIVIDTNMVAHELLWMPDLRRGQDTATWLQILRAGHILHGLEEPLAKYRRRSGSLSSSKLQAVKRTWHTYRHVERLEAPLALGFLLSQLYNATRRRRPGIVSFRRPSAARPLR